MFLEVCVLACALCYKKKLLCFLPQITPVVDSRVDGGKYPGDEVELTFVTANWTDPMGETTGESFSLSGLAGPGGW